MKQIDQIGSDYRFISILYAIYIRSVSSSCIRPSYHFEQILGISVGWSDRWIIISERRLQMFCISDHRRKISQNRFIKIWLISVLLCTVLYLSEMTNILINLFCDMDCGTVQILDDISQYQYIDDSTHYRPLPQINVQSTYLTF